MLVHRLSLQERNDIHKPVEKVTPTGSPTTNVNTSPLKVFTHREIELKNVVSFVKNAMRTQHSYREEMIKWCPQHLCLCSTAMWLGSQDAQWLLPPQWTFPQAKRKMLDKWGDFGDQPIQDHDTLGHLKICTVPYPIWPIGSYNYRLCHIVHLGCPNHEYLAISS